MILKLAAWNVQKYLGDKTYAPRVIDGIKALDADVVILSEAYGAEGLAINENFAESLGYEHALAVPCDDAVELNGFPRREQATMALARIEATPSPVRLASRNAVQIETDELCIIGAHFDDRAEAPRQAMAKAFLELARNTAKPTILAGDLNSLYIKTIRWPNKTALRQPAVPPKTPPTRANAA